MGYENWVAINFISDIGCKFAIHWPILSKVVEKKIIQTTTSPPQHSKLKSEKTGITKSSNHQGWCKIIKQLGCKLHFLKLNRPCKPKTVTYKSLTYTSNSKNGSKLQKLKNRVSEAEIFQRAILVCTFFFSFEFFIFLEVWTIMTLNNKAKRAP